MAVGRGDGCVSIYDADYKPPAAAAAGSGGGSSSKKGSSKARQRGSAAQQRQQQAAAAGVPGRLALLGREQGGHTSGVNSVSFLAGSDWQQLLSAGNDCRLLLWNWKAAATAGQEAAEAAAEADEAGGSGSAVRQGGGQQAAAEREAAAQAAAGEDSQSGVEEGSPQLLAAEHKHPRKINWACSADVPGCSYNVFLADTGRRLTALALAHN